MGVGSNDLGYYANQGRGGVEASVQLGGREVFRSPYLKEGVLDTVVLWNTMDLGYLTIQTASALAKGTLKPGATALAAGRLKSVEVRGDNVLLGTPFTFLLDSA